MLFKTVIPKELKNKAIFSLNNIACVTMCCSVHLSDVFWLFCDVIITDAAWFHY